MNLTTKTVQGVGWSGISRITRLLLQLGMTALLARLLTPNDFGLLAMVVVFTNLVMVFRDFGLTAALIQRKGLAEEHLSSGFWVNVLVGLLLTLLLVALAPAIAYFYGEDRLTLIIMVLASTFFMSSFGIVQTALLTKELNFKPLAIIEISAVAISGTVAIVLAFAGFGVWSLVWQQVISSFVTVIFLWTFSSWRPKLLFRWQRVKELLSFGLNLTGFNFVNYFNRNLDNLLIGKFLGSAPLGFYNLTYQLLLFPLSNISHVAGRVMFPSFSTIQDDKSKVRHSYIRATRYIATVTFPMMIGLLVVAPQFIRVIFGSQWERSIFLVQILALVGLMQSISTLNGTIYQSQGRTDIQFHVGIIFAIIVALFFIIGLHWDVEGVTVAYAIATLLLTYPCFAIPFKLINLKFSYFIKQFNSLFLATVAMGAIVFAFRIFLETTSETSDLVTLISTVVVGIASYTGLLFILDRNLYREVFQLLRQLKPPTQEITWQENYDSQSKKERI
ncbi:MAG: MOP flippase family protein [Candidatus Stahlbacteria bacterium]|nr:MAG: MOP flippase family protein [Candidatus Stahlbacteria bacterium]